jgi:hypothetical protein
MLKLSWKQHLLVCVSLGAIVLAAGPAEAQYGAKLSNRATGETYNVEITGAIWDPTPSIFITSESIRGIPGTKIDFVEDLGIEKNTFKQLRVVLRPAMKHKFRFEYTPIKYEAEAVLKRTIVFNGLDYFVSLPVETDVTWRAYRFGYEYDFVYRDRGFVGLVLEAKYTDIKATLTSAINDEFVHAQAPIPAVGVIGRGYVAPNISITGEFTFFKLPDIGEDYGGRFFDFDLYGTINFNDHVGAQGGYRSFDVQYLVENDNGQMTLKGLYFGGVVRF